MTELDGKNLWARLKTAEPDALTLAAYAEGRLDRASSATVERWLALDPDAAGDVAQARAPVPAIDDDAAARVAARALPLVSARILAFRPRVPRWAEITAIAASLVLVAYLGFELGTQSMVIQDDTVDVFDSFTIPGGLLDGLQA
jgi:hypothetical protein